MSRPILKNRLTTEYTGCYLSWSNFNKNEKPHSGENMIDSDLEKYSKQAMDVGVTTVKQISPDTVITAAWVRMKCLFGCPVQGYSYSCPPHTPTPAETQTMINDYSRALLFHTESPFSDEREKNDNRISRTLVKMEGEMFKDGLYKSFLYKHGPCFVCKMCKKTTNEPCVANDKKRPSMESAGIDVYQTARNNDLSIGSLNEVTDTQNLFALMLVD